MWYNELHWDIPQWRCWGVLISESRFFSFMFKDSNSVNNHFPDHSYCSVFVFKSPRIFLPEVAGIWVFPSGRVIFFLLTSHSFVKLGKFHKSLGHSSDVQIQTCTSILFLSWWGCWCAEASHPAVGYPREGGTGDDSERSRPFWMSLACDPMWCTSVSYVIMKW